MVDKTTKNLHDWRAAETKSKKQCYGNCRENEKIQDMMLEARLGRGKTLSEKEALKVCGQSLVLLHFFVLLFLS